MERHLLDPDNLPDKNRVEEIHELIFELAGGNLDAKKEVSDACDEYDAIITGINMLGEELKNTTVSRDYLNSIYKGIADFLIILSPDNIIVEVNNPVIEILGFSPTELIGKPFSKILKYSKSANKTLTDTLKTANVCYNLERLFKKKNGELIPVNCSVSRLYNTSGLSEGLIFIATDITHIKKAEERLQNKNKELDSFVYKVSHDIRGPLASIMGITSLVHTEVDDKVALGYFSMIQECSKRLDVIVNNLLKLAVHDHTQKTRNKINFKKLLKQIIETYSMSPELKLINFTVTGTPVQPFYNNEMMLSSVLQNLIDNAIKYRKPEEKSEIIIKIEESTKGIYFNIKDNGVGIKQEHIPKIFDIFFRGNSKTKGTGIGLYMVKTYVERMGGEISVTSIEDQGTCFALFLPNLK